MHHFSRSCRSIGLVASLSLAGFLAGCSDDNSNSNDIPADAEEMQSYLQSGATLMAQRLSGFESFLPFLMSPDSQGAEGLQFEANPDSSAPPFSYTFNVPMDGDGDGIKETTVAGGTTLNRDPATAGVGFGGEIDLSVETLAGLGNFDGAGFFSFTSDGRQMSGQGTFSEFVTGNATTLTVAADSPLHMSAAANSSDRVANACGYSLDGGVQFEVTGPTGTLSSMWEFAHNRSSVSVSGASFTDGDGITTELPDTDFIIPCGDHGDIADWAGVFTQDWACLPPEYGRAELTITVKDDSTISITDEDPPGSGDINEYEAQTVPGNPHVVRGFFIGGEGDYAYREDFTWILASGSESFSQISTYVYPAGPMQGQGGICGGRAKLNE